MAMVPQILELHDGMMPAAYLRPASSFYEAMSSKRRVFPRRQLIRTLTRDATRADRSLPRVHRQRSRRRCSPRRQAHSARSRGIVHTCQSATADSVQSSAAQLGTDHRLINR